VPVRSLVWRVVGTEVLDKFVRALLSWLLVGGALHVLTSGDDEDDEAARWPLVVARWVAVPWALGSVVVAIIVAAVVSIHPSVRSAATGGAAAEALQPAVQARVPVPAGIGALTTGWSGWIHYHGVQVVRDVEADRALYAAGLVAVVGLLLTACSPLSAFWRVSPRPPRPPARPLSISRTRTGRR